MKILLADDTEINRLYLSEALSNLGCTVQTSVDGAAALQRASAERFDLLVLDIRMPQLFGDEVLRLLRQDRLALSRDTPAVAVSSEMDATMARRLLGEGFVAALAKPVQAAAVLEAAGFRAARAVSGRALESFERVALDLDDALALRALGTTNAVQRLRRMLAQELRVREPELHAAVAARQASAIREWIHQLRASCALCGATRLDGMLRELRAAVLMDDWRQIATEAAQLRQYLSGLCVLLDNLESAP